MNGNFDILDGLGQEALAGLAKSLNDAIGARNANKVGVDPNGMAYILPVDEQGNVIRKDATQNVGVNTALGLAPVPMEGPAKYLVPILTPFRNMFARTVYGGPGKQYRRITGINTKKLWGSTAEFVPGSTSGRNGFLALDEKDATLNWKKFGIDNFVTPEARTAGSSTITPGQDFNPEQVASITTLQGTMLLEEQLLLGGQGSAALAAPAAATKSATQVATGIGGLTAATTYYVRVSALTLQGIFGSSTGNGGADASGETTAANEAALATASGGTAGDKTLAVQWVAIPGAVAYNVFFGTSTGNSNCKYVVTTAVNCVTVNTATTANKWTGTATLGAAYTDVHSNNVGNTANKSQNALDFDGLIYQAATGTNAYFASLNGAALTSDGKQGVAEILALFKSLFDNYRVSPTAVAVASTQRDQINAIIVGNTSPAFRTQVETGSTTLVGGLQVAAVLNPYFNLNVPLITHPNMPNGTIVALCDKLGQWYPTANIPANLEVGLGYDYQRYDYAFANQAYEMGVYARGGLIVYAPFALGVIQNIYS